MVNVGKSKKKILTRCIEHKQDGIKGNWESYGATEHIKDVNSEQFKRIYVPNMCKRKVREALEINKNIKRN